MNEYLKKFDGLPERYPVPGQFFAGQRRYEAALPDNIMIFCRRLRQPRPHLEPLAHHRHVLFFALRGEGSIIINGERFVIETGTMLLIQPHQMHLLLSPQRDLNWLYVTFEAEEGEAWDGFANHPLPFSDRIGPYLEDLLDCGITEYGVDRHQGMRAALNILQILNTLAEESARQSGGPARVKPQQQLVDRVNRHLFRHLDQPLEIAALAESFGYSVTHFRRVYREFMEIGIGEYLRAMRHARAQQLLRVTNLTLDAVGRKCGYGSGYAFAYAFKRREGMPPGEFRRRFRQ